jgi:hypothetical protein
VRYFYLKEMSTQLEKLYDKRKMRMLNQEFFSNDDPILDTRQYEVEFSYGDVFEYAANDIAQNLYSNEDHDGK